MRENHIRIIKEAIEYNQALLETFKIIYLDELYFYNMRSYEWKNSTVGINFKKNLARNATLIDDIFLLCQNLGYFMRG